MVDAPRIRILFDEAAIAARVEALAGEIAGMALERPLVVPVLKGSFVFAADLLRALHRCGLAPDVEFIQLASYLQATTSSGTITIVKNIDSAVKGRDVVLIDDILESGKTLSFAKDLLAARQARRVITCVLIEKPGKRAVSITPDLVGFTVPDLFVVGYGMDVAHAFRQLPFVGVIERGEAPASAPGRTA
jgi:hypoxanthine phosphoribosyltransferase